MGNSNSVKNGVDPLCVKFGSDNSGINIADVCIVNKANGICVADCANIIIEDKECDVENTIAVKPEIYNPINAAAAKQVKFATSIYGSTASAHDESAPR